MSGSAVNVPEAFNDVNVPPTNRMQVYVTEENNPGFPAVIDASLGVEGQVILSVTPGVAPGTRAAKVG